MKEIILYIALSAAMSVTFLGLGKKWDFVPRVVFRWTVLMLAVGMLVLFGLRSIWPAMSPWTHGALAMGLCFASTLVTMVFRFYRDPERTPPLEKRVIVAPADGRIVYVKRVQDGTFPFAVKAKRVIPMREFTSEEFPVRELVHIGIEMTYLDVHINRAPIAGKITRLVRIPGLFRSLRFIEALLENERVYTLIQGADITVGMLQIASRMVRRIIPFVNVNEEVVLGQRIGTIRFGSQVDLLVPSLKSLSVRTSPGDLVCAGETVLATY